MANTIKEIIERLNLVPHPEGGYYRETYRSDQILTGSSLKGNLEGERNCSTAIYFMLTSDSFSAFHRIKHDEIWHFYSGSPIEIHMIHEDGAYELVQIGLNLRNGVYPQYTVPANTWFAASILEPESYGLVGCTVSPGFDFRDFEMGDREKLSNQFPQHNELINRFTRIQES